ncbi:MAG: aminotransferase [Clostridiaceae bacterium]|nr:aminotransferase [Clostridiaceae bacterium]
MRDDITLPSYANPYDAGMDVCAAEDVLIKPGQTAIIPTGLKFAIPEGYEIQVRPRSGISYKTPLRISNSPGTIDAGYRDELVIIMTNTSPERNPEGKTCDSGDEENEQNYLTLDSKGNKKGTYLIKKGERVAQLILAQVPRMNLIKVDSVSDIGFNRGGGFGSTGVK